MVANTSTPRRSSSPPAPANDRVPRASSPATAPPACTPPASSRTSCTCTTTAPGTRAVIVGAELVSWSAAMTLREARCRPVLMISAYPAPEAYAAFTIPGRLALENPRRHSYPAHPHHRPRPGKRRRNREPRHAHAPHNRLRHRRPHRRLDPGQRTGPRRRPRDRPQHAGPSNRHRTSDQQPRRVRDRQPHSPGRHRGCRRSRWSSRRPTRPRPPIRPASRSRWASATNTARQTPQMDHPGSPQRRR